jgi:exopolysaccharide biosynthesis polyprenyl glycosylphosphotransferase
VNTPSSLEGVAGGALDTAARVAKPFAPHRDVRQRIDDRARRGFTESSRRALRVLLFVLSDMSAGAAAVYVVLSSWILVSAGGLRPLPDEVPLLAAVLCLQPLALYAFGAYGGRSARLDLGRLVGGIFLAALMGWVQARLFGRDTADLPNKVAYLYMAVASTGISYAFRHALEWSIRAGFRSGALQRRMLVIGSAAEVARLSQLVASFPDADVQIVGSFSTTVVGRRAGDMGLYPGSIEDFERAIENLRPHGIIIASTVPFEMLTGIMSRAFEVGLTVSLVPRVLKDIKGSTLDRRQSVIGPLLEVAPLRFDVPQLAIKRTMDLILVTVGLMAIWPLLLLIAMAIKLDSRGPVLFRQTRAGLGGRPFGMFKFRTMRVGAEDQKHLYQHLNEYPDPRLFKIKDDPRVTRLGRLLRRSSLDELPQLLNVLRGQMSLVGPRPCTPDELQHYAEKHRARLFVMPGITGPWQVSGRNEILDFEHVVRLEIDYIESWSIVKDLLILLKTVPAIFRRGAY